MFGRLGAGPTVRIFGAFTDPEPIIWRHDDADLPYPVSVIRSEFGAPAFDGAGATLRTVVYEIEQDALPARPTKKDSFAHRGRRWAIDDVTRRDDIGAWTLIVSDAGPE